MSVNLVMPQLGESVIEGTVTKWLVREGDSVAREQAVVAVATDKADTEVPATQSGRIVRILAHEGDTVKIGAPLCEIEPGADAPTVKSSSVRPPAPAVAPPPVAAAPPSAPAPIQEPPSASGDNGHGRSSPVVRKLA